MKKCNDNFILAIETSCDDTSIALFKNNELLSLSESTSIKEYQKYGGIIPEIASRKHEECINEVYLKCLSNSKIEQKDINYIAYTAFPGLPGSLHVGKIFAKTLSFLLKTKLIPVDHMMGHAFSFAIENPLLVKFPLLSLVVSGGNTILYLFSSLTKYVIVNQTVDDPLGECLDKIGRMIGLGYPGGVSLDKNYDESKSNLQLIKHLDASKPFSFSGIKSFAHNYVNTHKQKNKKIDNVLVGSSCLKWCIEDIIIKLQYYINMHNVKTIGIGGGVAANALLQHKIKNIAGANVYITSRKYCGDNAAMIGFYVSLLLQKS